MNDSQLYKNKDPNLHLIKNCTSARYSLDSREACDFIGISYPTLKKWIETGRIVGARKDPMKKKSPWQFTRTNCIDALNYNMHNDTESVDSAEEKEIKCQSSEGVKTGMQATRLTGKGLRSRLAQRTKSKRRSCTTKERLNYGG